MAKALHDYSIAEAGALLRSGKLTSTALTEHALDRIKTVDPKISSFITLTADAALRDAAAADADFAKGVDNVPKEDSVVAAKFKAQGAVLLGKLATHEFALGGPSFDLPFPPARNPWNP